MFTPAPPPMMFQAQISFDVPASSAITVFGRLQFVATPVVHVNDANVNCPIAVGAGSAAVLRA